MKTYTLKPLVWKDNVYNIKAETAFGLYIIRHFDGQWSWGMGASGTSHKVASLEAAKAAAEAHYRERILTALEAVG